MRGERSRVGPLLTAIGAVLLVVSVVVLVTAFVDTVSGPRIPVPGEASVDLEAGTWTVHQRVDGAARLRPDDLLVEGDGISVESMPGGFSETVTLNEVEFVAFARLRVTTGGTVAISTRSVGEPSAATSELLVTRGMGDLFRRWPWFFALLASIPIIIVGLVRWRRRPS